MTLSSIRRKSNFGQSDIFCLANVNIRVKNVESFSVDKLIFHMIVNKEIVTITYLSFTN